MFSLYTLSCSEEKTQEMEHLSQWLVQGMTSSNPLFLSLLFFFFLFLLLVVLKFKKPGTTKYNFPPSPSKLPFIGNMHQLLGGSLHHALYSLSQKHGPLMWLHLVSKPTLVVSSADMAQAVMKTYDHVFSSRPHLAIPNRLYYNKDIAFAPYGEYWRQVRKICVLQLLSAKKVRAFRAVREEEVALVMDKIKATSAAVNLSTLFVSMSNNVVCRVALGRKYDENEGGGMRFKRMVREFTCLFGVSNIEDMVPSLGWMNSFNGLNARVEKNFREVDSFLDGVIEEHLANQKKRITGSEEEEDDDDMVDTMLRNEVDSTLGISITRETTKALVMDMFVAGTDTSSIVLEWAMSELIKHPEIMIEVQKEVRDVARGKHVLTENDIGEISILKAVVKETLRLHPPLPLLVPRESMEDVKIGDYHIPAQTTVMVNAFAISRDPIWWKEPEKFLPNRFLNGSSTLVDFKGIDFQLIPFGAGRRGCPGILFATSVIELTIANLLNRFEWTMPNGMDIDELDMHEGSGITVHRKVDLVLNAKPYYEESH